MTTHKVDFKQVHKQLYTARADPVMVDVPELPFLMADGAGDPATTGYQATVQALYGVAYAIRFALKQGADQPPQATTELAAQAAAKVRRSRPAAAVAGRHHEIYLSDPSRTTPEKLKTIIRYPVRAGVRGSG
jgi:hypothetical protein